MKPCFSKQLFHIKRVIIYDELVVMQNLKMNLTLLILLIALFFCVNVSEAQTTRSVEEVLKHTEADLILADNIKEFDV